VTAGQRDTAVSGAAGDRDAPTVDCAIVIVTYNSSADVDDLLDSIDAGAGGLSVRTIVVDNASTDDTVGRVRSHPDVQCIETGANTGYAAGINTGRAAAGPYRSLLVLNPDLRVEPGAIRSLFEAAREPAVGIAVPVLRDPDGTVQRSLRREPTLGRALGEALFGDHLPARPEGLSEMVRDDDAYRRAHDVDWATGAAFLVTAACDEAVGPWDARFFMYSEEVDYARRARRAGFRVTFVPDAVAVHHEGGSGASDDLVALMAVNRVRLFREQHGAAPAAAYRAVLVLHALLRWGDSGQRAARGALTGRPVSVWLESVLRDGRPPT
jgi:GT2 family glycosyltransferase